MNKQELIDKITERIDSIKIERQRHIDNQRNYHWSEYERENGSVEYGRYQEREEKCNLRIRELEWILTISNN